MDQDRFFQFYSVKISICEIMNVDFIRTEVRLLRA